MGIDVAYGLYFSKDELFSPGKHLLVFAFDELIKMTMDCRLLIFSFHNSNLKYMYMVLITLV